MTDQLGSPRVLVDSLGQVVSRRDFMPFGEEITPDGTRRTGNLKYNFGDNIRQKFTGYQKDKETSLDFAEARMYENRLGRFTAVDPLLGSGVIKEPQSFNRFVYVMNNPVNSTDPTGLWTDRNWSSGDSNFFADSDHGIGALSEILAFRTIVVNEKTGEYRHFDDGHDVVLAVSDQQFKQFQALWNQAQSNPDANRLYHSTIDTFRRSWRNVGISQSDFFFLASTVYAESSGGYRESQGIVNVLRNRAEVDGTSLMTQVSNAPDYGVRGATESRRAEYFKEQGPGADQKRLNVHRGIALGLTRGDITGGAFFWDGLDFNQRARGNNSGWKERHQAGYYFTHPSHDLYNQRSYRSPRWKSGYYYESTTAIGSTTFSRKYGYSGGSWR
ncbi:MAG: RHS repeat-associated core domain-containing protein [Acidobacteria bacterium]|nr:RHS repeat-associated core domain-containing protein [Acidobacteriota bacterium]